MATKTWSSTAPPEEFQPYIDSEAGVPEFTLRAILAGRRDSPEMRALLAELHHRFVPSRVVLLVDSAEAQQALAAGIPSIESMNPPAAGARAYVCRNYTCQLPVSEPAKFAELIQY